MNARPKLGRRLVLEERVAMPDGAGGFASSWRALGTLWAEVTVRSGSAEFAAAAVWPRVRYRILVRAAPPGSPSRPRPEQRLREGERVFNILTVTEADPGGRYLELLAEEGILP